jgi:hypothetical protein
MSERVDGMRYILHVGPHKTGTSYIQKESADRRDELRAVGILYPKTWNTYLDGHTGIYHQLRQGHYGYFGQHFDSFKQEAGSLETALLSNENLEDLSEEPIEVLASYFKPGDTKVVYYIRNWSGLLASTWQESIKHGSTWMFPEYLLQHLQNPFNSQVLNYNIVLGRYAKYFGAENIIIRSYDNVLSLHHNIFEDLLSTILGGQVPLKGRNYRENTSENSLNVEVLRLINVSLFGRSEDPSSRILDIYMKVKDSMVGLLEELETIAIPYFQTARIEIDTQAYRQIEAEVLETYKQVGPFLSERRSLADARDLRVRYCSPALLLDRRAHEIMLAVISKVHSFETVRHPPAMPGTQRQPVDQIGGGEQS